MLIAINSGLINCWSDLSVRENSKTRTCVVLASAHDNCLFVKTVNRERALFCPQCAEIVPSWKLQIAWGRCFAHSVLFFYVPWNSKYHDLSMEVTFNTTYVCLWTLNSCFILLKRRPVYAVNSIVTNRGWIICICVFSLIQNLVAGR